MIEFNEGIPNDTLLYREVLDRSFLIMDMFAKYVAEHGSVTSSPELSRLAEETMENLYRFHNSVIEILEPDELE